MSLRDVDRICNALGVENLANLIAEQINDALEIELRHEPLLHTVDDGEFRRALFSLFEQALGLIEKARVFKCHAHRVGKGVQQAHIAAAKSILLVTLNADNTGHFIAQQDGHGKIRFVQFPGPDPAS